jgi:DNA (cytosine-5)-methyltransferase 1
VKFEGGVHEAGWTATGTGTPQFTCGALFAGIGGFCLGFEQAQFSTHWAVELDEFAAKTYTANLGHVRLLEKSVKDVTVAGDRLEPVDVLHAGFPCQSFSQAGERRGFDDPRGRLFFEIIRLIEEFEIHRPKVLVLENAPFLRYGEGGAWFLELERAIRKAGYWFGPANCAELTTNELTELPQQRTRLYMVALSMDTFRSGRFSFPNERHPASKDMRRWIDFDGIVDQDYYLPAENRYFDMISKSVTDRECLYQLRKYEVRPKERGVCPTLTANMGLGGHNVPFIMNCQGLRKLTEYECLALQGFPGDFDFPAAVPRAKRYVQVGNAVSVPIAKLIAESIRNRLLEEIK